MRCTKNPRLKNRGIAMCAERALEINFEHIGILLRTLHTCFLPFSYKRAREFVAEYTETVREFDEDPDVTDYMINSYLEDMPYLTWDKARHLIRRFGERAKTLLDAKIFADKGFVNIFAQNLLLMLIQLHCGYGFGKKRMTELIETLEHTDLDGAAEWLKKAGIELVGNTECAYELIAKIERKDKPISTAREQLDARRQLEALKAYQSEVSSRDKLAGAGTPESP